jgi:hypothetical protein
MDPKEVYDPLYKGVFTASERERLWRLRKDYEEHKKSELSYWWCEPSLSEDASASSQDYYCLDRQ